MEQEPGTRGGAGAAWLIDGVHDWLASGERVVPPALAELPDDERELLMNTVRDFRDTVCARLAEMDRNRSGQEGER